MESFFTRHAGLLDNDGQERLQRATVVVCGCGGLGGYVVEQLARIGVGRLLLLDPDSFSVSNLNRQLLATRETLGCNKSVAAVARVQHLRPECRAEAWPVDLRAAPETIWQGVAVVMDCLDSAADRLYLAALCNRHRIPLVHGAVRGWYGQVGVQLPGENLIERLYPRTHAAAAPVPVFSCTVGCIASVQTAEAVKLLLGRPSALRDGFVCIDLDSSEWHIIPTAPQD